MGDSTSIVARNFLTPQVHYVLMSSSEFHGASLPHWPCPREQLDVAMILTHFYSQIPKKPESLHKSHTPFFLPWCDLTPATPKNTYILGCRPPELSHFASPLCERRKIVIQAIVTRRPASEV